MTMKLLGATESHQNENPVGYNGFARHPSEPDFPQFTPKQQTWTTGPTGDDAIINVSFVFSIQFFFCIFIKIIFHSENIFI